MKPAELLNDHRLKWDRLRQAMQKAGADGCLLTADVNLYYLTGKIFSGYFYLPVQGEPWIFAKRLPGLPGEKNVEYIYKPEQLPDLFTARCLPMPQNLLLEADQLPYNEYMRLENVFAPARTLNASALLRRLRQVKTPWEIAQLRHSARLHADTYARIPACFCPGMTDLAFQYEIERCMRKNGSLGIFRAFGSNMDIFMGSVLAGSNAEEPSPFDFALGGLGPDPSLPIGANGTVLRQGMAVMVDMAGNYTAYLTDMTRVFAVGKLPDQAYRAHRVALVIQQEIEKTARPGVLCSDLYHLAVGIAREEGLQDCFMGTRQQAKFIGHGIGIEINELPVFSPRSKDVLEPGMAFALEPKFVIPQTGAVGIENSFLVTAGGVEKLTQFQEEIIPL